MNTRRISDVLWEWADGTFVTEDDWANTAAGEPSGNGDCTQLFRDHVRLDDIPCDVTLQYVCEIPMF